MSQSSHDELTAAQKAELEESRPYRIMMRELWDLAEAEDNSGFDIAANVIDEIATASTIDEVFAVNESGPKDAENLLGKPLGVISVRWWKSSEKFKKGTLGVYAAMDYIGEDGEKDILSVGAPNVVASLFQLQNKLHAITGDPDQPLWVQIKGRDTANGTLYTLHAADRAPF